MMSCDNLKHQISEVGDDGQPAIRVNLDTHLQCLLREVHYLQRPPFDLRLTDTIRSLIRNIDVSLLRTVAARLETVASHYNSIIRSVTSVERPLLETKVGEMEELLTDGVRKYSWKEIEATDFVERATHLVCDTIHRSISILQGNMIEIQSIVKAWSVGPLDIFTTVSDNISLTLKELNTKHRELSDNLKNSIESGGRRIHMLMQSSFSFVQISRASPAWIQYTKHISQLVIEALKASTLVTLKSMLRRLSEAQSGSPAVPILVISLELVASEIKFSPPLNRSSATHSLQEYIEDWLTDFLSRGSHLEPVSSEEDYQDIIQKDPEVQNLVSKINDNVEQRIEESKEFLAMFKDFAFLWMQDVKLTFDEFLKGNISSRPSKSADGLGSQTSVASVKSRKDNILRSGSASSTITAMTTLTGTLGTIAFSEKHLYQVKRLKLSKEDKAPTLDDFDKEIDIYRNARDEIHVTDESCDVGWIRVNMQPIKKTLETYASKWMFTFTRYLSDQVSSALSDLDTFLKRIEPGVEAITGEERDIYSFMRLMRIFNEVTAQQTELDTKFATMKKTLALLEKFEQKLPDTTQKFYSAAPVRWNNLKMKVNQAKQRLGPRIQAEAKNVTETLQQFGERCKMIEYEFRNSDAFMRKCPIYNAHNIMDSFQKRLEIIEGEAQDLVELQELLEKDVVDFSILPSLRSDLGFLRQVWETVRIVEEQQTDWKRQRWQKMKIRILQKLLRGQSEMLHQLPEKAHNWDVAIGLQESINDILSCIPIMEDLGKAAMRTRHWKQLVRATGGAVNISNEGLTRMTLGQFLELGLQYHADEVRKVVQRATKDVGIEKTLKTYEEIWLSKTFDLAKHTRLCNPNTDPGIHEVAVSDIGNDSDAGHSMIRTSGSRISMTSMSMREERRVRTSVSRSSTNNIPINLSQESGNVCLLKNVGPILDELELHQVSLQSMLGGAAASSFTDDIVKWQKTLQNIESVLVAWWEVQEKWMKLDDVFSSTESRVSMPRETHLFAASSNDFRSLMMATEKNPNVLQSCSKANIQAKLEKLNMNFEHCLKTLFNHLERRKQRFPRFYLLSEEDVLNIVCKGYDPGQVNSYLHKIIHNAGAMEYDVAVTEDHSFYRILGLRSLHGEFLQFTKPVTCDAPVETWLNSLITAIRTTLQIKLASALRVPIPESFKALASEVPTSTLKPKPSEKPDKKLKKDPSRRVLFASEAESTEKADDSVQSELKLPKSWSLSNTNEIIILALQIELTKKIEIALYKTSFEQFTLENLFGHLCALIDSVSTILRGQTDSQLQGSIDQVEGKQTEESNGQAGASSVVEEQLQYFADNRPGKVVKLKTDGVKAASDQSVSDERKSSEGNDGKLVLFPGQIQMLTNLVFILSQKRDIATRLINIKSSVNDNANTQVKGLSNHFEWQSQLKYYLSEDTVSCKIRALENELQYGFEYQGTACRLVCTPLTERYLFWLYHGLHLPAPGLLVGSALDGKTATLTELSRICGFPVYMVACTNTLDTQGVGEIFKGVAATGSWVCFQHLNKMNPSALSVVSQLISSLSDGIKAKRSTVIVQDDEVPLLPQASIFATLSGENISHVGIASTDQPPFLASSLYTLPENLLLKFRVVGLSPPDTEMMVKVHFIVHGFSNTDHLSKKLSNLYTLMSQLIFPTIYKTQPMSSIMRISKIVISNAGDHVEQLNGEERSPGQGLPLSPTERVAQANTPIEEIEKELEIEEKPQTPSKSQSKETKNLTEMTVDVKHLEEKAIVLALRDTFMPSLSGSDAVMFATIVADLFPDVDIPTIFNNNVNVKEQQIQCVDDIIGVEHPTEAGEAVTSLPGSPVDKDKALSDENSAIRVAAEKLELQPGAAFLGRVMQLKELISSHKTVLVVGPSGCGKTECIRTLMTTYREMGNNVIADTVCPGAVSPDELFGHFNLKSRQWSDGLLQVVLRKKLDELRSAEIGMKESASSETSLSNSSSNEMRWIHIDGEVHPSQMPILADILKSDDMITLPSMERLHISTSVRFLWEIDSLDSISPSVISSAGILLMSSNDVGWPLLVGKWLCKQPQQNREHLMALCNQYIEPSFEFLSMFNTSWNDHEASPGIIPGLQSMLPVSEGMKVQSLFSIFEALISSAQDASVSEYENYFNFAALWAFGGTLTGRQSDLFEKWWREQWQNTVRYPDGNKLWDCYVHPETHEFIPWNETLPSFSSRSSTGIAEGAHVPTVQNTAISHLVGAMVDAGKPVLLVGPSGCGKSTIIRERLRNQSSDAAEMLALFIDANEFLSSKSFWHRQNEYLEWKHAKTYVPKGNKRLACLIDDLNCGLVDGRESQSACEMVRQILDHKGAFYKEDWQWREIQGITYLGTYNPWLTVSKPIISERLLRHWTVIYVQYPSIHEQHSIFSTLLDSHFLDSHGSSSQQSVNTEAKDKLGMKPHEKESFRSTISLIVSVTIEVQEKMKEMFLPTSERCYYIFTLKNLSTIFRNLCLTLRPGCSEKDLLLLWRHECDWLYGKTLIDVVDKERWAQVFATAAKKRLTNNQMEIITDSLPPFTNLIDMEDLTKKGSKGISASSESEDHPNIAYRPVEDFDKVREILDHNLNEYNKDNPKVKIIPYDVLMFSWIDIISVKMLFPSTFDFFIHSMEFQLEMERSLFLKSTQHNLKVNALKNGCSQANSVLTFDFSMYTLIPHELLEYSVSSLVHISSKRKDGTIKYTHIQTGPGVFKPWCGRHIDMVQSLEHQVGDNYSAHQKRDDWGLGGFQSNTPSTESTLNVLCRLIRIIQLPHECGNVLMLADGSPSLPLSLVKISAYLCGFTVFQINPSSVCQGEKYTINHFKMDIIQAYTTAGVKGDKLLFALSDLEILDESFLIYIEEFLVSSSISHLFSEEEQTSITNAIRTEVTQAGLSYTKEVAWNFFLGTVRENLRVVLIMSSYGPTFQKRCRKLPRMFNSLQVITLPHWSRRELVANAYSHLKDVSIFDESQKENIAHLLSAVHETVVQKDDTVSKTGKFGNITNTTFENFVELFVDLVQKKYAEITTERDTITKTLQAVEKGTVLAEQLKKELNREHLVLEQKNQGNNNLLRQIGQRKETQQSGVGIPMDLNVTAKSLKNNDKAITEEQVRLVQKQQLKIERLKKLLPKYQDAHERAVFKAAAMVKDIKQVLAELDQQGLSDLRSMQKPDGEIEDVLAAIIIIVKSPVSDLTWNKGAKRIMANLERFREELSAFDEMELTAETLHVVEPYTKRPHFTPGYMERKTSNNAIESLVLWVRGVVRYHLMMQSRVKPLHLKVEQTSAALDEAVERLGGMESKLKDLGDRMFNLSNKYEDASVDKSKQAVLTEDQKLQLERATYFEKILSQGREKWKKVLDSISRREIAMAGHVTLAAAFACYLGPYDYAFRRDMMTKSWLHCLEERGIQLDLRLVDSLSIDITLNVAEQHENAEITDGPIPKETAPTTASKSSSQGNEESTDKNVTDIASSTAHETVNAETSDIADRERGEQQMSDGAIKNVDVDYDAYCTALIKILIGENHTRTLVTKGIDSRQLEDIAIMKASKQKPLLVIDPFGRALSILKATITDIQDIVLVDMSDRESNLLGTVEKCVTSGSNLVLYNIDDEIDSFLFSLIDHINTTGFIECNEPSVIKLNGRRLMIHPSFQLSLVSRCSTPKFSSELSSTTTLLDLRPHKDGIISLLKLHCMTRIRPDLCLEMRKAYYELFQCLKGLEQLDSRMMNVIKKKEGVKIWEETEYIANLVEQRGKISERLNRAVRNLDIFQDELRRYEALAEMATSIFYVFLTLKNLKREYQFSFDYFMSLFDQAVGGEDPGQANDYIFESDSASTKHDQIRDHDKQQQSPKHVKALVGIRSQEFSVESSENYKGNKESLEDIYEQSSATSFELPPETPVSVPEDEKPTTEEIRMLKNKLLQVAYQGVSRSLSKEHLDSFVVLLWLCTSSVDFPRPDPMLTEYLLMTAESISKKDPPYYPSLVRPKWLPLERWNASLAISASYEPLKKVHADISAYPDQWMTWYNTTDPEQTSLPFSQKENEPQELSEDESQKVDGKELAGLESQEVSADDMTSHTVRLFVVKFLRPDRFQVALMNSAWKSLANVLSQDRMNFRDILNNTYTTAPVLLLLPANEETLENSDKETPSKQIIDLTSLEAKASGKTLLTVQVFDGNENMIDNTLSNAVSTDSWILIQNLHLGNAEWLRQLSKRITRLSQQPGDDRENRWRILMTSEPCDLLPIPLLYLSEKLSWDFVSSLPQEDNEKMPTNDFLKDNIVNSIKSISDEIWISLRDQSLASRSLVYSLSIVHGVLLSRQRFCPRTFTKKCAFSTDDLRKSINWILHHFDSENINATLNDALKFISEMIYGAKVTCNVDCVYLSTIFNCLRKSLTSNQASSLEIGEWITPVPPANVDPLQYGDWFADRFESSDIADQNVKAIGVHDDDVRSFMRERSSTFMTQLNVLYKSFFKDTFDVAHFSVDNHQVKQTIDHCLERLPTLLKIDNKYGLSSESLIYKSHLRSPTPFSDRSSIKSADGDVPPSLGYCLLKECRIFNETLWRVWSDLSMLNTRLISGSEACPENHENVIQALQRGSVPSEWLHPFERPTTKNLFTWLEGFMKRRQQLNEFLRKGLIPKPTAEPISSHGILERVNLGLFVNPGAILTAYRHEKAIHEGVSLDEIDLKCVVFYQKEKLFKLTKELHTKPGIMLEDLHLEGASWDDDRKCLTNKRASIHKLGSAFIIPTVKDCDSEKTSSSCLFSCPVFMNRCRQKLAFYLPLPCEDAVEQLVLQGTALFLDSGNSEENN